MPAGSTQACGNVALWHTGRRNAPSRRFTIHAPGGSVVNLMGKVVESAAGVFGGGFFAMLYQSRVNDPWQPINSPPTAGPCAAN
jgi:hypothetical protein